jgi:hypothetical protein
MKKSIFILLLGFLPMYLFSQTLADEVKTTLQNLAKAWTAFPKTQDKASILKFYDIGFTGCGYSVDAEENSTKTTFTHFTDERYNEINKTLDILIEKIALGTNLGIYFKLGEIKKIEVSQNLAYVFVDYNDIKMAVDGNVFLNQQQTCTYILKKTGADWKIIHISSEGFSYDYDCFVKGTMITLANGNNIGIENLKRGSILVSLDDNNKFSTAEVDTVLVCNKPEGYNLYTITFAPEEPNLIASNKNDLRSSIITLNVTSNHPFNTTKGILKVKDLKIGDDVFVNINSNLEIYKIANIQQNSKTNIVYNVRLKGNKTFFVNNIATLMK